ncbi:Nucleoid-associated protein YbaB [Mycobacterium lentiflavum]|uniref:Nucleoid-associated protein YbaB n=1 Tax=Mycobacterium lentiflavum TaxID=141349 RepID=A0A0E4GYY4_MYCLN|nr:YbaB/EbfC family nucleoid-associated protein [Mycobacterium lentiflavum]CQD17312.1 Nucleoid-associated protein YbaB [Mycobacterium lentiflavum]
MGSEMSLQPAELLRQLKQIQSAVDEQARQLVTESFTGTDEANTVEATLDGRQWLTNLHLQDGLLRLGIETVTQRINEAIQNAQAVATAAGEVEQERFIESLASIASSMPLPDLENS